MEKIVLASGSPRRKELLARTGVVFSVVVSNGEENTNLTDPAETVEKLSQDKAISVAPHPPAYESIAQYFQSRSHRPESSFRTDNLLSHITVSVKLPYSSLLLKKQEAITGLRSWLLCVCLSLFKPVFP